MSWVIECYEIQPTIDWGSDGEAFSTMAEAEVAEVERTGLCPRPHKIVELNGVGH